jgi:hypothetical protein
LGKTAGAGWVEEIVLGGEGKYEAKWKGERKVVRKKGDEERQ